MFHNRRLSLRLKGPEKMTAEEELRSVPPGRPASATTQAWAFHTHVTGAYIGSWMKSIPNMLPGAAYSATFASSGSCVGRVGPHIPVRAHGRSARF